MKKYLILILFFTIGIHIFGQNVNADGIGFSSWLKEPINGFSEQNTKNILVKIDQIIARNSAGSTSASSVVFAIYPEFIIVREDIINTGMKPIHVIRGELSLFAVNKADLSNYGSMVISLEGNGSTKTQCIQSMISRIRPTDPVLARFIKSAKEKIFKYYSANLPKIITKANSLINRAEYSEALVLLSLVPEGINEYEIVANLMSDVYMKSSNRKAKALIHKAKSLIVEKKYTNALNTLLEVEPLCTQFNEAEKLVSKINAEINQEEKEKLRAQIKIYNDKKEERTRIHNDKMELEKMKIEASRAEGEKNAKIQAKEAEESGSLDWFLEKFKYD